MRPARHDAEGFWLAELGSGPAPAPSLRGDVAADVLVVGGGYSGLWTAWWCKRLEPEADVVLVEAGRCGRGPSGRNGGFCNSMWFSLPTLRRAFGDEGALAVARRAAASVDEIGEWCREQDVDAHYRRSGYLQVAAAGAQEGSWAPVTAACEELGVPDALVGLDREQLRRRCSSPVFRAAALYPDAATVHPARLALGLRQRAIEAGVRVFERSPFTGYDPDPAGGGTVQAGEGRVRCRSLVLATGPGLLARRDLRRALTATSSHMIVTEPVPDLLEQIGWTGGECITDSRTMVHYFRTTRDGRIAFGWGGGRIVLGGRLGGRVEVDPRLARATVQHLLRFFPGLKGRRIEHAWGGPIDVSPTHLPVIRTLGAGRFAAYGYTGNGVGPSQMLARSLASLALDLRDEHSALPLVDPAPVRVPPEPFRWVGGSAIRRAILRKEQLEERGRRVDPLTRLLCGIPERVGIHVGR